jgi:hypothetical protein
MDSKIQLSDFERELLLDPKWILTKNNVIKKSQDLLSVVRENIMEYTRSTPGILPMEVLAIPAKISKGENYLGLPWLILDFPRHFDKENIFAIRTMMWWGRFFSTTLHLSGRYKEQYSQKINDHFDLLSKQNAYVCINEDQWKHHLEYDNYQLVQEFSKVGLEDHIRKNRFIKLAKKHSLSEWDHAIKILSDEFVQITKWLN